MSTQTDENSAQTADEVENLLRLKVNVVEFNLSKPVFNSEETSVYLKCAVITKGIITGPVELYLSFRCMEDSGPLYTAYLERSKLNLTLAIEPSRERT